MSLAKSLTVPSNRETPAELEINGEKVKVTIRYKSASIKDSRAQRELFKAKEKAEETVYKSDVLAPRVLALVEENGDETKVTLDLLENMSIENLSAIEKAINEAENPKPTPDK